MRLLNESKAELNPIVPPIVNVIDLMGPLTLKHHVLDPALVCLHNG